MIRKLENLDGLEWIESLRSPAFQWTLDQLESLRPSHHFWGLFEKDRVVAVVALIRLPGAWEIPVLATHPQKQRHGLMRTLLSQVIDAQCQDAEIWLEVHESNTSARHLYGALGFQEVGRRPRYYSDGGTALLLTRPASR